MVLWASIGTSIGLATALLLTPLVASLLYGISASDPHTFSAVIVVLIAVAMLASYILVRRAAKVDPMVSLRYE
jgi:putative ABC transport system permease protein